MEYGVNVTNKFAFLDEDVQDPEEVIAKAKLEKKLEKAAAPAKSKVVAEPPKAAVAKPAASSESQKRGGDQNNVKQPPAGRGPPRGGGQQQNNGGSRRGPKTGDHQPSDQQQPGDRKPPVRQDNKDRPPRKPRVERDENAPPRADNDQQRGPPRGGIDRENQRGGNRGGDRGGRGRGAGPRGPARPRAPPKDESQQAKVEPQEKDALVEKSEAAQDAFPDTGGIDTWDALVAKPTGEDASGDETAAEKPAGDIEAEETEPPQRVLTLEEWRAEHKKEEPQFKVRKPGEGGDTKIYQKLVPIKKDEPKEHHDSEEELHVHKEKREKAVGIDVQFADNKRGGDRDGGRGGGGFRGGPRGDRDGGRSGGGGGFRGPREGGGGGGRGGPRYNDSNARSGGGRGARQPADSKSFNLETQEFPALGAR